MANKNKVRHNDRKSNRIYPSRICQFPDCGQTFEPHDARQKYCCEQHRINHNNDRGNGRAKEDRDFLKRIKTNTLILEKIYNALERVGQTKVNQSLLEYENFDFNLCTSQEINTRTGNVIYWCKNYGIEGVNEKLNSFIIHKK